MKEIEINSKKFLYKVIYTCDNNGDKHDITIFYFYKPITKRGYLFKKISNFYVEAFRSNYNIENTILPKDYIIENLNRKVELLYLDENVDLALTYYHNNKKNEKL